MTPIARVLALDHFGIKLGLDNIRTILDALGHPERNSPAIHIAGTNGKGSAAAMLEAALRSAGYRTGRYTSPHLDRLEERFAIDGVPIASDVLEAAAAVVLDVVDRRRRSGELPVPPTFFEVTTAIGFEIFRLMEVEASVIEVGLGGRFDATNVIEPLVCAITSIDFDHERYLGATLAAIASEKAGIAKRGVPLILGTVPDEAYEEISATCDEVGAPLVDAAREVAVEAGREGGRATVALSTPVAAYPRVTLALPGAHQVLNAQVVVRTLEIAAERGLTVGATDIAAGLTTAEWPARLEWLAIGGRALLVDAAHNPAGAQSLASYLREMTAAPLPIVIGVMEDKDVSRILAALAPAARPFIATQADTSRAMPATQLAERIRQTAPAVPVDIEPSPDRAVARALDMAPRAVVAGSIYLVGPLRARLIAAGARHLADPR